MRAFLPSILAACALALPAFAQDPHDLGAGAKPAATQAMPAVVPAAALNGIIGQGSGGPCETTGTQTPRIFRNGVPSSCASPKAWPGPTGSGTYYYDTYQLVNSTGATQCVTMSVSTASSQVHISVYNGAYDPANQGANFLADSGFSASPGSPASLSVSVASGQTVVAVLMNPLNATGNAYTFTYDYLTTGCGPTYNLYFEDDQLRSRLWLNSTSGAWSMDMLAGPLVGHYTGTTAPILKNGVIALPPPTAPGLAVWGFYDPSMRRASFTLRPGTSGYNGFLFDTNTTGQPPAPGLRQ